MATSPSGFPLALGSKVGADMVPNGNLLWWITRKVAGFFDGPAAGVVTHFGWNPSSGTQSVFGVDEFNLMALDALENIVTDYVTGLEFEGSPLAVIAVPLGWEFGVCVVQVTGEDIGTTTLHANSDGTPSIFGDLPLEFTA